jgi:hypothetical protein
MSIEKGIGSIPDPSSPPILADALRFWFISEVFHVSTVTLLRLAFALHLRNMAKTSAQRWVLLVLMSITIVYNTGFFLLMLFQCAPVQYFWTGWVGEDGNSMEQSFVALISYGFAGVGAGTDWGLVLVSPWFFWEKDMNGRVKFCLRVLLVLGIW